MPTELPIAELAERYDALLFDAYGVLVHAGGPMPGAVDLLANLRTQGKRVLVVTNDASRLPETSAARLRSFGFEIPAQDIVTSGSLIAPYFRTQGLRGARCMVLGPKDTASYVAAAGGVVVPPAVDERYDAIIVGDDAGYPFLDTMDTALTALYRHYDRGDELQLILPNPDLVYPKANSAFGFTSGAAAMLLEAALQRRYPAQSPRFVRLGKPHAPIFAEAERRAGTSKLVMIGDQLETDIAGARDYGMDAALLLTGVTRDAHGHPPSRQPTWILRSLEDAG